MRYLLQIAAMTGDLILLVVCGCLWASGETIDLLLFAGVLWVWFARLDGLCAWRPSVIRQFMRNAKRAGL